MGALLFLMAGIIVALSCSNLEQLRVCCMGRHNMSPCHRFKTWVKAESAFQLGNVSSYKADRQYRIVGFMRRLPCVLSDRIKCMSPFLQTKDHDLNRSSRYRIRTAGLEFRCRSINCKTRSFFGPKHRALMLLDVSSLKMASLTSKGSDVT